MLRFKANELKERIDLLCDGGAEVITFDAGFAGNMWIEGYSPYREDLEEYQPTIKIMEAEK